MKKNQHGFTLVELMIATATFSILLLVVTTGMLEVGRLFYKSSTIANTQEVTRIILEDITQAIQFEGESVTLPESSGPRSTRFCVGSRRYTFDQGEQMTVAKDNHVLIVDRANSTCNIGTNPANLNDPEAPAADRNNSVSPRELMGLNMRLANIRIEALGNESYTVTVRVVYGDDDVVCSPSQGTDCGNTMTSPFQTATDLECKNERSTSQFCATSELSTTVKRRLE